MPDKHAENSQADDWKFEGFQKPESNFFKMPNVWTDITAKINSLAELKVVEYVLRHTWGYQEYEIKKRITTDEFMNGRKRQDGTRMDLGTGLSNRSVIDGLRRAVTHGLLVEEVDDRDKARIKKFYSLNMMLSATTAAVKNLHSNDNPDVKNLHSGEKNLHNRSEDSPERTEKDTLERNIIKNVVDALIERGLTPKVAYLLADERPEAYLWEKMEIFDYLVETGSHLISRNPAGYLRKAISEDYSPPKNFQTRAEREAKAKQANLDEQDWEKIRQAEKDAETRKRSWVIENYRIPETLLKVWEQALVELEERFAKRYFDEYLKNSFLLSADEGAVTIGVWSEEAQVWLESRGASTIARVLEGILTETVSVSFAIMDASAASNDSGTV